MHAVTGNIVYNYFSHPCSYRVHLDLVGERREKSAATPAGRYLMERGIRHEKRVFEDLKLRFPGQWRLIEKDTALDHEADLDRRAEATLRAMREGVAVIFSGIVRASDAVSKSKAPYAARSDANLRFRGETDILLRVDDPSPEFGAHSYVVGDVKSSYEAVFAQKMQVAFYSWILEDMQGLLPRKGFVVNGLAEREDFDIDALYWTLRLFVEEEVFDYVDPAKSFFHLEPRCRSCHWHAHCEKRANDEDDVSLIPGSTRTTKRALGAAGILSRADLKKRSDDELRRLGRRFGHRLDGFRDLQKTASAQDFKRPMIKQHPRTSYAAAVAHADAAPDVFRHQGAFLLIGGLFDGTAGSEACLGSLLRRKDEVLGRTNPSAEPEFFRQVGSSAGNALLALLARKSELERLLAATREPLVCVLTDGSLEHRLRHVAEKIEDRHRGTIEMLERFFADSVVLTDIVDRTYYLPIDARRVQDIACVLPAAGPGQSFEKRSPIAAATLLPRPSAAGPTPTPDDARRRILEVADDYGLDREAVLSADADLRPLFVREWRSTHDPIFESLVQFETAEELRAAESILGHLLRLCGEKK